MADVSIITANGIDYNIKDSTARSNISTLQGNMSNAQNDIGELQTEVAGMIASGTGYCKLSDGTLIQYGKQTSFSLSDNNIISATVTMGQAFIDTNYVVMLTAGRNSLAFLTLPFCEGNSGGNIVRTTTTFAIAAKGTSTNIDTYWLAIGRWK